MLIRSLLGIGLLSSTATAVTVYGQTPLAAATKTISSALPTFTPNQTAAYDTTVLTPPAPPSPPQGTSFTVTVPLTNTTVVALSIMQHGSFYGFSIEMSVVTQLRKFSSLSLQPSSEPDLSFKWEKTR